MTPIALVLLLLVSAQAQPAPQEKTGPPSSSRAPRKGLSDAELTRMLDAYAIEQAERALELTSSQYTAFAPRLRRYQEMRRRHVQGRNKILQQLRELTVKGRGAKPDEAAIRSALAALREHGDRAAAEVKQAYRDLDEVLDLRQQGRFRVFEEAMERRKLDMILRAREGNRGK